SASSALMDRHVYEHPDLAVGGRRLDFISAGSVQPVRNAGRGSPRRAGTCARTQRAGPCAPAAEIDRRSSLLTAGEPIEAGAFSPRLALTGSRRADSNRHGSETKADDLERRAEWHPRRLSSWL